MTVQIPAFAIADVIQAPAWVQILVFCLIWVLLWLPIALPLAIHLQWQPGQPLTLPQKLPLVAVLYVIAPFLLWGSAQVEQVPFSIYGLTWQWALLRSFLIGAGLGLAGLVIFFGVQVGWGWRHLQVAQRMAWRSALLPTLALGIWISVTEELVFRGFLLNHLQRDYGVLVAAIVSSVLFALSHLLWEGGKGLPNLPGLCLMGLVLVLARWADGGQLGLACGLHAAWVWGMTSLDTVPLLPLTDKGPKWLTGGEQPLAGGLSLLLLLITAITIGWLSAVGMR